MPGSRPSSVIELLVPLERESTISLHHQLEEDLRDRIRKGRLTGGATMPSTRALAGQLGVARGVVVEAYEQLIAEGYLLSRPGGSTRVADIPAIAEREVIPRPVEAGVIDLRPGRPAVAEFPRTAWARASRRVLNEAPSERLTYLEGMGVPELRAALASYLARSRGAATHPDDIVVTTGVAQALHLIRRALVMNGATAIAVEDPSEPAYRESLSDDGLTTVPVPVDDDGLVVSALDQTGADAVVVTPAHQYPTGAVLSPERRTALLAWARDRDAIIVEDDYDAEFRYDREPIGAMQGLDPEHVIYAGTASKSVAPGLRLGWLAAPRRLAHQLVEMKQVFDHGSGALDQLVFADIIQHGELDRHLRRMRAIYRKRRDVLLASLAECLPGWITTGASAGLHVLAYAPQAVDEAGLVASAEMHGVRIYGLSRYQTTPDERCGVVFGYGAADERQIQEGVSALATLLPPHS